MLLFQHKFVFTKIHSEMYDRQGTVQKAGSKGHKRQCNKGELWKADDSAQRGEDKTEKAKTWVTNSSDCQDERESTGPALTYSISS